jgi:hypothetical protein
MFNNDSVRTIFSIMFFFTKYTNSNYKFRMFTRTSAHNSFSLVNPENGARLTVRQVPLHRPCSDPLCPSLVSASEELFMGPPKRVCCVCYGTKQPVIPGVIVGTHCCNNRHRGHCIISKLTQDTIFAFDTVVAFLISFE